MKRNAKLALPTQGATWVREMELPRPFRSWKYESMFYEMLNVQRVVVGDRGYDVPCIVELEGTRPEKGHRPEA